MSITKEKLLEILGFATKNIEQALLAAENHEDTAPEVAEKAGYHRESIVVTFGKLKVGEVNVTEFQLVLDRADKYIKGLL